MRLQCGHGTKVGQDWVDCIGREPCCGVAWALLPPPPSLPQTLSLHPTNLPPSVLQEKCMEEVGPGAVLDLRTRDRRFHCQERCTRDQGKSAGAQPCGLNAFILTAVSMSWGSFLDLRPGGYSASYALSSVFTCSCLQTTAFLHKLREKR